MSETVLILGAGLPEGIGGALALRFARAGYHVLIAGRTAEKLDATKAEVESLGGAADTVVCDVTSATDMDNVFRALTSKNADIGAVFYNAGGNAPIVFDDLTEEQFEAYWRVSCFGAFLAAKRAMPLLAAQGRGSMFFTGASASMRGRPMFAHFASAKAALRNLVQALAREYGPRGVHVAHIIIDGVVNGDMVKSRLPDYLDHLGADGALEPAAIAESFWMLHNQQRSAWTHEIDLRPFKETW